MYSRTSISTKLFPLLLLCFACGRTEVEQPQVKQEKAKSQAGKSKEPGRQPEGLTRANAVSFLQAYAKKNNEHVFLIETRFGSIKIELFDNTPLHRANFAFLTSEEYFDETWFYRVSKKHVIQAGSTDGRNTIEKRKKLGDYRIPAEIVAGNLHVYGAVAAARSYKNNPEKETDPYEFYIVLGKTYSPAQLKAMAGEYGFSLDEEKTKAYAQLGGAPHLDGEHTVFGRVIEGMEVVEEIARQETDEGEWPLMNIPIRVRAIK